MVMQNCVGYGEQNQKLKEEMCERMDEGSKMKNVPGNWCRMI